MIDPERLEIAARTYYEKWAQRYEKLTGEKQLSWDEPDENDRRNDWISDTEAAITAYLASEPDNSDLVERLRKAALFDPEYLGELFNEAADALSVKRQK